MSLKDQFKQWKTKLEGYNREHNILPFGQGQASHQQQQQQPPGYGAPPAQNQYPGQQQQYYNRPPPVPQYSHPGSQGQLPQPPPSTRYWTARFDPSTPVNAEWEQKQGNNNGWGNAELENYTSNPENSFYTHDNKLVIRAITHNGNHTSARLVSKQTLSRSRGCLTTYLNLPSATGIWPAFWLLPREPFTWPHDGEVDIAEAWNGERQNHSCLHWGFFTPEDNWKHRVRATDIPEMTQRAIRFDFVWHDSGRLIWYVDDRAVMKAIMPQGARRIEDWCIIANVAMGGNVCQGKVPRDGAYDMVIHTIYMSDEMETGGWARFEHDWQRCPDGNTM